MVATSSAAVSRLTCGPCRKAARLAVTTRGTPKPSALPSISRYHPRHAEAVGPALDQPVPERGHRPHRRHPRSQVDRRLAARGRAMRAISTSAAPRAG